MAGTEKESMECSVQTFRVITRECFAVLGIGTRVFRPRILLRNHYTTGAPNTDVVYG